MSKQPLNFTEVILWKCLDKMLEIPAAMTAEPVKSALRLASFVIRAIVKANREKPNRFGG